MPIFKPVALGLAGRNNGQGPGLARAITPVSCERLAVTRVNLGVHKVGVGTQCRQRLLCGVRIIEHQRRNGIVPNDLGLHGDIAHQGQAKAVQVIGAKAATSQKQGHSTHQHVHQGELLGDRILLGFRHDRVSLQAEDSF